MDPIVLAYLLGLTPTLEYNPSLVQEWKSLSDLDKTAIIRQFEDEYHMKIENLTYDTSGSLRLRNFDRKNDEAIITSGKSESTSGSSGDLAPQRNLNLRAFDMLR